MVVAKSALFIFGKGRMRRIKNASADLKHIAGLRHRFRIGIRRQLLSAFVEVLWLGYLFNRAGLELIGPLQIGVLVRRLIDGIGAVSSLEYDRCGSSVRGLLPPKAVKSVFSPYSASGRGLLVTSGSVKSNAANTSTAAAAAQTARRLKRLCAGSVLAVNADA